MPYTEYPFTCFLLNSVIGLIEGCSIVASKGKFYTGSDHVINNKVLTRECNVFPLQVPV